MRGRFTTPSGGRLSASAIEHCLIAALIAVAIITALGTLRTGIAGALTEPGSREVAAQGR